MASTLVSILVVLFSFNFMSSPREKELLVHFSSVGKIKEKHFYLVSGLGSRVWESALTMTVVACVGFRPGETRCRQEVNQILKSSA